MGWFKPRRWIMNVLIALDQFGNAITGGAPDETISSRSARAARDDRWWGRWMCKGLNFLDSGHCEDAIRSEETGAHLPPALRRGAEVCDEDHPKPS